LSLTFPANSPTRVHEEPFIDTGLVSPEYLPILDALAMSDQAACAMEQATCLAFSVAVSSLYHGMDDNFQFPLPLSESANEGLASGQKTFKDLRGVACPMNFVKTKMELSRLARGGRLELWLDEGEAIQNVPGSVTGEGHEILLREKVVDHWRLVIEKR